MKYLIIKPVGGLANRIRVVEAGYNYAQAHKAKLTVIWEENFNLNAVYEDCFAQLAEAWVINLDYNGTSVFSKLKRSFYDVMESIGLSMYTSEKMFDAEVEPFLHNTEPTEKSKTFFDEAAQKHKGIFIETCYEFYPNLYNFRISIQKDITQKANQLLEPYPHLIGIHIRRTDNLDSIAHSPLKKFIDEINSHLALNPAVAFYLSTDSGEVVQELKSLFPDKIITGVSVRNRDSKEGIMAALTDLCCLSQCKKILGSFKSSFSERAAIIGNIPLQIVSV